MTNYHIVTVLFVCVIHMKILYFYFYPFSLGRIHFVFPLYFLGKHLHGLTILYLFVDSDSTFVYNLHQQFLILILGLIIIKHGLNNKKLTVPDYNGVKYTDLCILCVCVCV